MDKSPKIIDKPAEPALFDRIEGWEKFVETLRAEEILEYAARCNIMLGTRNN